ncbi:hypothetical protein BH10ACT3_BH10ACT3_21350 [soil metagenome]
MSITRIIKRLGQQGLQLVLLFVVIVATGVGIGLAAGYPVSRIQFEESDAVRLDQSVLADKVDPAAALTTLIDLPQGSWEPGDPAAAQFGLLGSDFCGEAVQLPTALSEKQSAVFANPSDQSVLISDAVRVDGWQSAKDYVEDVGKAVGQCEEFFRTDVTGARVKVEIRAAKDDELITDEVSRRFITSDGSNVQVWSIRAIGDVIVATQYIGPTGPQQSLMTDLGTAILKRTAPESFSLGGFGATTTPTTVVEGTDTTLIEGGAADESPDAVQNESTTTVP